MPSISSPTGSSGQNSLTGSYQNFKQEVEIPPLWSLLNSILEVIFGNLRQMPLAITRGRQRSFFRKLRNNRKCPDTPNENFFRGFRSPGTRIRSLFVKQRSPFGDKLRLSHPTLVTLRRTQKFAIFWYF